MTKYRKDVPWYDDGINWLYIWLALTILAFLAVGSQIEDIAR
jgi:hypothetical protein